MMPEEPLPIPVPDVPIPDRLPAVPLRDLVVFPQVTVSLSVSRDRSLRALDAGGRDGQMVVLIAQRDPDRDDPTRADLHDIGTAARIVRRVKLPDERVRIMVQGLARVRVLDVDGSGDHLVATLAPVAIPEPAISTEREALMRSVASNLQRLVALGKTLPGDVLVFARTISDPGRLADLASSHLDLKVPQAQEVLELAEPLARLRRVNELLSREIELRFMQREITNQAREEMGRSQREYFLREQLKAIQRELGEGSELQEEIAQVRDRATSRRLSKEAREEVERALARLERGNPESAEVASLREYLQWMVELPWGVRTKDKLDIEATRAILDADHQGLDAVKERILENLAVRKLRQLRGRAARPRGPVLCFVGPPGVGKTSLGRSIARALGRKFVRLPLGGVRDEAEIRGHRRTYVGALPGRIIQGLRQCGSANPVVMLDEVDKIGAEGRGDPAAALLEVLDPEQNTTFRDHYLGVAFDLSDILFIATANLLDPIHPAFRDRLEVIALAGYTEEEKLAIARSHLIPRQVDESGLTTELVRFEDEAIRTIVRRYTREAGLRDLERQIGAVCRKVAKAVASGAQEPAVIGPAGLEGLLGIERFQEHELLLRDQVGVATGLGLTAAGGEVLFVEAIPMRGRGQLTLTGQLGEVMRESAHAALSYARAHAAELGIPPEPLEATDLHLHIPSGATPKDGPSAGVTLLAAIVSALSGRPVARLAVMTGEITLRGEVLGVGGIRAKVLAARRAGARIVVVPRRNEAEIAALPPEVRGSMRIVLVNTAAEVLSEVLVASPGGST